MGRTFLLLALVTGSVACGRSDDVACGSVAREALDPNSGVHLLADEEPPVYATDPPTSGAHFALPPPTGVQAEPVDRPMQVTALEGGLVLVQYRDLPDADASALEELGSDIVVIAPNPDLPEPVVLTAWITKQACSGVDQETVESFIAHEQGRGPGVDF